MAIFNVYTRKYPAIRKPLSNAATVTINHQLQICCRFLRYGSSYTHCCRALTFASARLSCYKTRSTTLDFVQLIDATGSVGVPSGRSKLEMWPN